MQLRLVRSAHRFIRHCLLLAIAIVGAGAILLTTRAGPQSLEPAPLFVDIQATGNNDGSSWVNAFTSLDAAIAAAQDTGSLWIAQGTYKPANGNTGFYIDKRLKLYGGFLGPHDLSDPSYLGELQLQDRRGSYKRTILDGDIGTPVVFNDNVEHVVTIESVSGVDGKAGVILDGFRIKSGYALGVNEDGAGIWCHCSDLDLANCYFDHNYAVDGGALWFSSGCPLVPVPELAELPILKSRLRVQSCEFFDNHADRYGGAIYGDRLWGWVVNSKFATNLANPYGGAAYIWRVKSGESFDFTNCVFWENYCTGQSSSLGGALYFDASSSANGDYARSSVVNCTFAGNFVAQCVNGMAIAVATNAVVGIYNSILYWNVNLDFNNCGGIPRPIVGNPTVEYCNVEGGLIGAENLSLDPRFVGGSPPPTSSPGGANPPFMQIPDLTLIFATSTQAGSTCIDYGDPTRLPQDLADLDDNGNKTEVLPLDLLFSPRRVDRHGFLEDDPPGFDYLDRGAYERP